MKPLSLALLTVSLTQMLSADVSKTSFGKTADGHAVDLYTLDGPKGMVASIMTYGATVVQLKTPDKTGKVGDIALGFDSLAGYLQDEPYLGAIVGRYGNRIAKGKFKLSGKEYSLAVNNGANSLHGGVKGFDKVVWSAKPMNNAVEFTYVSKDGEEGYPGTLTIKVTYTMVPTGELRIEYVATTDKETVLNPTNHTYFNLAGTGEILNHQLTLHAAKYTPVDSGLIPTGELKAVKGTPFDFTTEHKIGERIEAAGGYDHNWVIDHSGSLTKAAEVFEPTSGRVLEVWTTQPGIQFYTGNFLDGKLTGRNGVTYNKHTGLCLETQHFPDSPNHPKFPSTTLKPGQTFHSTTSWKFSTR